MKKMMTAVAAAAILTLLAPAIAAAQSVPLRLASFANADDTFGQAQRNFAEELSRLSDGDIALDIFNNSTLGSNREAIELAKMGGIDFVVTGVSHATRYAPILDAVLLPYLWKDTETMFDVLDGEIGERINGLLDSEGLTILGWWDNGFRHVSNSRRPINEPGDMQGLTLRTLPSPVHVEFFRQLGAAPVPMDFSELLPALRQGVIDGQENPTAVVYPYQIYEVQRYYSLTGHVNEPMILLASKASLDRLAEDVRATIVEAARNATEFQREINAAREDELMGFLEERMEINEVPEATLERFREVAYSVYDRAIREMGPEGQSIVDEIIARNE